MRIVIATDAWYPQANSTTYVVEATTRGLQKSGHQVYIISPIWFINFPSLVNRDYRWSLFPYAKIESFLRSFRPEAIHVFTRGNIFRAVQRFCKDNACPYSQDINLEAYSFLSDLELGRICLTKLQCISPEMWWSVR